MKRNLVLLFLLLQLISFCQNFGDFASAIQLKVNGIDTFYNLTGSGVMQIGNKSFSGNLGSFSKNSSELIINGAELKTWKNWGANICEMSGLNYVIYPTNNKPSNLVFSKFLLKFKASCVNNLFTDGFGACSGSDQKWNSTNHYSDLTFLQPGDYTIEVFIDYWGSNNNSIGCETQKIINNSGKNFIATFSIIDNSIVGYLDIDYDNAGNQTQRKLVIEVSEVSPLGESQSFSTQSEVSIVNKIRIYPNPTNGIVKMDWENEVVGQIQKVLIQSYNSNFMREFPIVQSQKEITFDLTYEQSGVYYVKFILSDNSVINKTIFKN